MANQTNQIVRIAAQQKIQLIQRLLTALKEKWRNQFQQIQKSNNEEYQRALFQAVQVEKQRSGLLQESKIALDGSQDLSVDNRLLLSSLAPLPQINLKFRTLQFSEAKDPLLDEIQKIEGSIQENKIEKSQKIQVQQEKKEFFNQVKEEEKKGKQVNRAKEPPNRVKEPPNRFSKWAYRKPNSKRAVPMQGWVSDSIDQGIDANLPEITIQRPGNNFSYKVNLVEMKIVKISKNGRAAPPSDIVRNENNKRGDH